MFNADAVEKFTVERREDDRQGICSTVVNLFDSNTEVVQMLVNPDYALT